jgi:hypothetical protein
MRTGNAVQRHSTLDSKMGNSGTFLWVGKDDSHITYLRGRSPGDVRLRDSVVTFGLPFSKKVTKKRSLKNWTGVT